MRSFLRSLSENFSAQFLAGPLGLPGAMHCMVGILALIVVSFLRSDAPTCELVPPTHERSGWHARVRIAHERKTVDVHDAIGDQMT